MGRFLTEDLGIAGLRTVIRQPIGDRRGFLARLFCAEELKEVGWHKPIAQINHTHTAQGGTVRGMHYQNPPSAEMKLVTCIRGQVWDVAVDLRVDSPTFLTWQGVVLSADNNRALLIPEGCAHGFQALSDDVELIYCHSVAYNPMAEGGLNPQDPRLGIEWPQAITELSQRDQNHPLLDSTFLGLSL
ncbi:MULTISPECIES: dTDP-4-dehydrorhamnose 3,5-epimerase [unclassified Synechocystis]|nr:MULTISPECIES: dTDP-4-dehydrorhamnose 3,5-epimerase [unclassified Synechocystis]